MYNKRFVRTALGERMVGDRFGDDLGTVIGIQNKDGEIIEFEKPVIVTTSIEKVLLKVEQEMKYAVSQTMLECFQSFKQEEFWDWIKLWPT